MKKVYFLVLTVLTLVFAQHSFAQTPSIKLGPNDRSCVRKPLPAGVMQARINSSISEQERERIKSQMTAAQRSANVSQEQPVQRGQNISPNSVFPTGTLTLADPTFNRTQTMLQGGSCVLSGVGTAVRYKVHNFTLTVASNVTASFDIADGGSISGGTDPDTFLELYGPGGFVPGAACTNLIAADDDNGTGFQSRIVTTTPLAPGNYSIVVTSFDNVPAAPSALPWTYTLAILFTSSACTPGNIILDGGFETTNPGTFINPSWPATSTNFGTSWCTVAGCGNGGGTAVPRTGIWWSWFGGIGAAEAASAQQAVVIPSGATATLNYYLRIGSVTAPFNATLKVFVDGVLQTTIAEPAVAEAAYTLRTINLNAFANGLSHIIRFEYDNPAGSGTSNFNVDDVSLDITCGLACAGVPTPGTISGAGTACVGSMINLALSGSSTGSGISYQWKSSATPGGPYANIPGATNLAYTFTATGGTTYYIVTTTCANGGASANTPEVSVGVGAPVHSAVSATVTTACTPGAATITGTVSGGLLQGSSVLGAGVGFAIPDNNPVGSNSTIILPANTFTIASDLKVRLNIAHTWIGDLKITLTSPCGTTFLLDRPGVPAGTFGNSADVNGIYTFDLTAATIIPEAGGGPVIAPGNYLPSNSANPGVAHNWAGLVFPCAGAGSWILNISDNGGGDVGTLASWQILGPAVYTHTLTGPGTIVQNPSTGAGNSTANFTVTNLPAGLHTFTLTSTDAIGCSKFSFVTATIKQTPIITLVPSPTATICNGAIVPITATVPPSFQTFSQGTSTLVPAGSPTTTSGIGGPYPSMVNASGLPTTGVTVKSVKLGNFNHTFPSDVDVVLVSPTGQAVILMSDAGSGIPVAGLDYTFDNAAPTSMAAGFNAQGTYKPTNFGGGDDWPAPGPGTAPSSIALSTFSGDPNGDWKLYVVDDTNGDFGFIGNWEITFSIPSFVSFSPTTELFTDAPATIPYTGQQTLAVWAKPTASRIYTATSTVNGCTGTATLNVTVNQLPAITVQPISTSTLCPGNNVIFSVTATGTGPLTYQWRQGAVNLLNNVQISGATTNTLTIANINASNSGSYTCVVTGVCPPPAISNAAILTVATAPVISAQPANATVCVGSNTSFTIGTVGSVPPATIYQWQVMIPSVPGVWTNLTTGGSYTPTFTITGAVIGQHNNQYRVLVTNTCGQTTTSNAAILTVNALPIVTAAPLPSRICLSDTLVPLVGSPIGGSWSGVGVSGFNFVPTATAVGTYTLTYSFTSAAGCTATTSIVAKVEDCQERLRLLSDDGVIVYPNPNNGRFNIRINSTLYNYLGMKIYNNQGQLVNGYTVNGTVVNRILVSPIYSGLVYGRVIPVDLTRLPVGIYQVMLYYDDGVRTSQKTFSVSIPGH